MVFLEHLPMLQLNSSAKKSSLVVKKQQLGTKSPKLLLQGNTKWISEVKGVFFHIEIHLPNKSKLFGVPVWNISDLYLPSDWLRIEGLIKNIRFKHLFTIGKNQIWSILGDISKWGTTFWNDTKSSDVPHVTHSPHSDWLPMWPAALLMVLEDPCKSLCIGRAMNYIYVYNSLSNGHGSIETWSLKTLRMVPKSVVRLVGPHFWASSACKACLRRGAGCEALRGVLDPRRLAGLEVIQKFPAYPDTKENNLGH